MDKADFRQWYKNNPLRVWRADHGLTMNQAASAINVAVKSIQLWEQGAGVPRNKNFIKLAGLLDIKTSQLEKQWTGWLAEKPN